MSRDPKDTDPQTVPKRFCSICGHTLAELNQEDTCFRHHITDDDTYASSVRENAEHDQNVQNVLRAICQVYEISLSELLGNRTKRPLTEARSVAICIMVDDEHMSEVEVAAILNRTRGGLYYPLTKIRSAKGINRLLAERMSRIDDIRHNSSAMEGSMI